MILLHSQLEQEEITVNIEENKKEIFLNLAKEKAKKILQQNKKYNYIIYGKEKEKELFLKMELTNRKPQNNEIYLERKKV